MNKILGTLIMLSLVGCAGGGNASFSSNPAPSPIAGPQGVAGTNGLNGTNGINGVNGTNGTSCTVASVPANKIAPNGGSLITCPDGTSSLVLNGSSGTNGTNGTNGSNGVNGTNGTNGTNGVNGTNGTVVTAVQFCSGITGAYPSTFPEVGFCIGGNLYAVYSANGGFLTEILPGAWSSDGINASCSFTVGSNCEVTK